MMKTGLGILAALGLILPLALSASAQDYDADVESAMQDLGLITPEEVNDVYGVVPGDTLWEIAEMFFGDPETWPGLWSINNEEITNPHYIYPGQVLRLQAGTDLRPPSLIVSSDAPDVIDDSWDAFTPKSEIFSTTTDCSLHVPFSSATDGDVTLAAPTFITRSPLDPLGVVEQAVPGKEMLARGDIVYMRFRNTSDVDCGRVYSLYHHVTEVRHPEVRSARLGHVYGVSAEVLISDVGDKWVTGKVVQSYGEVSRGELITDRVPVAGKVRTSEMSQVVDGFVIDKSHEENLLVQRNQVVFIDRGRNDGVRSGTIFWVVRRGDGMATKPRQIDQSLPDQVIGRLVVFAADDHVSTAVMTDQARSVLIGDRITSRLD
jgi:hypothetical protein